jgi:hypothetical protein
MYFELPVDNFLRLINNCTTAAQQSSASPAAEGNAASGHKAPCEKWRLRIDEKVQTQLPKYVDTDTSHYDCNQNKLKSFVEVAFICGSHKNVQYAEFV